MKWAQRKACERALRQVFGVPGYRPGQKSAASCLLSGRDLMCILPTGAGKSLCWQLPAVVHEGLTVVLSPLIALMQDQVAGLRRRGIPAATLNSMVPAAEQAQILRQIRAGEMRILFISPERLFSGGTLMLLTEMKPWLLVVDEAHCVVEWGREFRPAYREIGDFLRCLPVRPVICAMTATADDAMQLQIAHSLGMRRHKRVMLSVVRQNLIYTLRPTADTYPEVLRQVRAHPGKKVIFCRERLQTEAMAHYLRSQGESAACYHAGMSREARSTVQQRFMSGQTQVLAATSAFGMGVDIPDIRCVIHANLPMSITDLVQRSGRAGRDGRDAHCVILITEEDLSFYWLLLLAKRLSLGGRPIARWMMLCREWLPLRRLLRLLLSGKCITAGIAASFGQRARPCGRCSACVRPLVPMWTPDLLRLREEGITQWMLHWQRRALAKKRGVRPWQVISSRRLSQLMRDGAPPGAEHDETLRHFLPLLRPASPEASDGRK